MLLSTPALSILISFQKETTKKKKKAGTLSLKLSGCSLQSHFDKVTLYFLSFAMIIFFIYLFFQHVLILCAQLEASDICLSIYFANTEIFEHSIYMQRSKMAAIQDRLWL